MKHEPVVLIVDTKEVADEMSSVISHELSTTHIQHIDNKKDALTIIGSQARFDMIFVDWQLVGARFVDAVRQDRENGGTPVIVMSELDTDVVLATAMRHGASDYLAKPFLEKGLKSTLQRVRKLQQQQRMRRLHPDYPVVIDIDMEGGDTVQAEIYDFSLAGCCSRIDYGQRYNIVVGERGLVHLNIGPYQIDLESCVTRTAQDSDSPGQNLMVLFSFIDSHEERVEKLQELLNEYIAKW